MCTHAVYTHLMWYTVCFEIRYASVYPKIVSVMVNILLAFSSAELLEKAMDREMVNMMVHIDNLDECMRGSQCKMGRNTPLGLAIIYIYIVPLGNSCIKSRGLSSKNRFILYSGFPLWLGSTVEGCDSIEVSGCQTRAWRSTFYIKASLVHIMLGVLIPHLPGEGS